MQTDLLLLLLTTDGRLQTVAVPDSVTETARRILDCEAPETLRLPVAPPFALAPHLTLCAVIDERGRDRNRPMNPVGGCLYHTDDGIAGDVLLARCDRGSRHIWEICDTLEAFPQQEAQMLMDWLTEQFPTLRPSHATCDSAYTIDNTCNGKEG